MNNRIKNAFAKAKSEGRGAFVAYLTIGFPTIEASEAAADALVADGADVLELGVPFSDPFADGGVIRSAAYKALENGVSLRDVIALAKRLRARHPETGLVLFSYYNPIFSMGLEAFADVIADAGIDAVLSVDLPLEEREELLAVLRPKDIGYIIYNGATKTASFTSPILEDKECSKKHSDKDAFSSPMHEAYPSISYKAWGVVQKTILAILDSTDISEWAENATVQNCQMASAVLTLSWKLLSQLSGLVKELFNRDLQVEREGELLRDMESYANIERYLSVTPLSPAIKPEEASKPNPANAYVIPGSSGQTVQAGGPPPVQQWGAQPVGPASYGYGYAAPPVPMGPAPQDGSVLRVV